MASTFVTFFTVFMMSAYGSGVDSASLHLQCDSDHQCPDGFFCYDESHYCTRCVECIAYKRKLSWRSCPKTPSDCGACITGHEEEILHEGKTRDMCIPSSQALVLSNPSQAGHSYERYVWAAAVTALLLPILFYAFCRKNWRADRSTLHHGLPHEEPPPYRSIELDTLTTTNSVERMSEENLVLRVGQQKDLPLQAVPFRQPDYAESELLAYDNINENSGEDTESSPEERAASTTPNIDLHDDNTMPSDWTPAEENATNNQLLDLETADHDLSSEDESCEPANKRHRGSSGEPEESCHTQLNINLFINNNVTIHKQS